MASKKIKVVFEVDEDALKNNYVGDGYDFQNAINAELGWVNESGLVAVEWEEVQE